MANKELRNLRAGNIRPEMLVGKWKTNAGNNTWFVGGNGINLEYQSDGYWALDWSDGYYAANLGTFPHFNSSSDLNVEDGYAMAYDCDASGCIIQTKPGGDRRNKQPSNIENGEVSFMVVLSTSRHDKKS